MNTRNLIALTILALAFVLTYGPSLSVEANITTSQQGVTLYGEAYTLQQTETEEVTQQISCTTDTDCVTKYPEIIPDEYTIDDYLRVHGDTPHFPTIGDCTTVDWLSQDEDGRPFTPVDLNNDGAIDCDSDYEMGA